MASSRLFDLQCSHCGSVFPGTYKQRWNQQKGLSSPYCSPACRLAASSQRSTAQALKEGKTLRKGVLAGPCKKCGAMYQSRIDKSFCSIDCYVTSDQFRAMQSQHWSLSADVRAKIAASNRTGSMVPCLECGEEFYRKKGQANTRKFCGKTCYRSYMAKRFDRWMANPENMALPQCYDEFLDSQSLRCVVDGCTWEGAHLTIHINQAHGLPSAEFKRATGFNLGTGVISRPLAESLQSRPLRGVAANYYGDPIPAALAARRASPSRYVSLESREHQKKARVLMGPGPSRACRCCGGTFNQSSPAGRTLYCSVRCRTAHYAKARRISAHHQ